MNDNTSQRMTLGAISRKLQLAEDYCDYFDRVVDMSDIADFGNGDKADRGPLPGGLPDPGTAYGRALIYPGATAWAYINEIELRQIRARCRVFTQTNPYAIGAARNRVAYTVGSGHTYKITGRQDDVAEQTTDDCLKVIEDFRKRNKWPTRQKETVRRLDRDGERFLRLFVDEERAELNVRFVEPLEIQNAPDKTSAHGAYFGIGFKQIQSQDGNAAPVFDIETPVEYYIVTIGPLGEAIGLRETVPADQIQHLKANVDMTWPRGLPTFWALMPNMQNAVQTLKATGKIVEFRARIGMIRRHVNAAKESVQKFIADAAKAKDGPTPTASKYPFAAIIDTSDATEYQFPAGTVPVDGNVAAIQAELRTCASALAMPEYMISGDASNANFSSTMVAEAPAVKTFEEMQADLIEADVQILERQLVIAAKAGLITDCSGDPDSDSYVLDLVKVEAEPPIIKSENRLEETQADQVLFTSGLMSKATFAARHDLIWSDEDEQRKAEHLADPTTAGQPAGAPPMDGVSQQAGGLPEDLVSTILDAVRQVLQEGDPAQPRKPKGTPGGGQWTKEDAQAAEEWRRAHPKLPGPAKDDPPEEIARQKAIEDARTWASGRGITIPQIAEHAAAAISSVIDSWSNADKPLVIRALDVGHGGAVFLHLPNGKTILFDCGKMGSPYAASAAIREYLAYWNQGPAGIRLTPDSIDAVILSHDDTDHYNALPDLIAPQPGIDPRWSISLPAHPMSMIGPKATPLAAGEEAVIGDQIPTTIADRYPEFDAFGGNALGTTDEIAAAAENPAMPEMVDPHALADSPQRFVDLPPEQITPQELAHLDAVAAGTKPVTSLEIYGNAAAEANYAAEAAKRGLTLTKSADGVVAAYKDPAAYSNLQTAIAEQNANGVTTESLRKIGEAYGYTAKGALTDAEYAAQNPRGVYAGEEAAAERRAQQYVDASGNALPIPTGADAAQNAANALDAQRMYAIRRELNRIKERRTHTPDPVRVGAVYVPPQMFKPGKDGTNEQTRFLYRAITESKVPIRVIGEGDSFDGGNGCRVTVVNPAHNPRNAAKNARAIALEVTYKGHSVLLTSDMSSPGTDDLLAQRPRHQDLITAPHHGSADPVAAAEPLSKWATPSATIVQADHRWNTAATEATYGKQGVVYHTADTGAVKATIDKDGTRVETYLPLFDPNQKTGKAALRGDDRPIVQEDDFQPRDWHGRWTRTTDPGGDKPLTTAAQTHTKTDDPESDYYGMMEEYHQWLARGKKPPTRNPQANPLSPAETNPRDEIPVLARPPLPPWDDSMSKHANLTDPAKIAAKIAADKAKYEQQLAADAKNQTLYADLRLIAADWQYSFSRGMNALRDLVDGSHNHVLMGTAPGEFRPDPAPTAPIEVTPDIAARNASGKEGQPAGGFRGIYYSMPALITTGRTTDSAPLAFGDVGRGLTNDDTHLQPGEETEPEEKPPYVAAKRAAMAAIEASQAAEATLAKYANEPRTPIRRETDDGVETTFHGEHDPEVRRACFAARDAHLAAAEAYETAGGRDKGQAGIHYHTAYIHRCTAAEYDHLAPAEPPKPPAPPSWHADINKDISLRLEKIPNVTRTTAQAIEDERDRHGPYKSNADRRARLPYVPEYEHKMLDKYAPLAEDIQESEDYPEVPAPDIVQHDHYSCGAAQAMTAGRLRGVGPATLDAWKTALGTSEEQSTEPPRIVEYLASLGLRVIARSGMNIDDLEAYTRAGWYVIICCQDYGPYVPAKAKFDYGHYLGVVKVDGEYVRCQDSSEDNVTRNSGSIQAPGRIMIARDTFDANWHDKDINGTPYVRYGIAVGPAI